MTETMYGFGLECTWYDLVGMAARRAPELVDGVRVQQLCCPICGGFVAELSEADFWVYAKLLALSFPPELETALRWGRGMCFPNADARLQAYRAAHPQPADEVRA